MACYNVSPYTCTYHSDGAGSLPGGGSPDYSALATWEGASDNDLTGYTGRVILNCHYKNGGHNDSIAFSGATGLSSTIYRVIRSAPDASVPFAGSYDTGAYFYNDGVINVIYRSEPYSGCEKISVTNTHASASDTSAYGVAGDAYVYTRTVHCIAYNCANSGDGEASGFRSGVDTGMFYGCIAIGCDSNGFYLATDDTGAEIAAVICCSAIGNTGVGFRSIGAYNIAFSCYSGNNGADFTDTASEWGAESDYNVSGDETADLGGEGGTYANNADYFNGGAADAMDANGLLTASIDGGRNPYSGVSATYTYDGFIYDGANTPDALFGKSIEGDDRPSYLTENNTWDVGASEYVAPAGGTTIYSDAIFKFDMRSLISSDLTGKFDIRAIITSDSIYKYDLLNQIFSDIIAKYDSRSLVTSDLIAVFDLFSLVQSDMIGKYDARGAITSDLIAKYDQGGIVYSDLTGIFNILSGMVARGLGRLGGSTRMN